MTVASRARRERRLNRAAAEKRRTTPCVRMLAEVRNPTLDEIAPGQVWEPGMVVMSIHMLDDDGNRGELVSEFPTRVHPDRKDTRSIVEGFLKRCRMEGSEAQRILDQIEFVSREGDYTDSPIAA